MGPGIDAPECYKVNFPVDAKIADVLRDFRPLHDPDKKDVRQLSPVERLSKVFLTDPIDEHLHIIVQHPRAFLCPSGLRSTLTSPFIVQYPLPTLTLSSHPPPLFPRPASASTFLGTGSRPGIILTAAVPQLSPSSPSSWLSSWRLVCWSPPLLSPDFSPPTHAL